MTTRIGLPQDGATSAHHPLRPLTLPVQLPSQKKDEHVSMCMWRGPGVRLVGTGHKGFEQKRE